MEIENNNKKNNSFIKIVVALLIGAAAMYGVVYFFPDEFTTTVTKTEKDVTVTDAGIADAVEKVYDAVVVVQTYNGERLVSSGTGFVYNTDDTLAYILTNSHVVDSGDNVKVTFTDGTTHETEILGNNEYEDIAVLTVSKDKVLQVAELGDNSKMRVGDTTFAVGAPLDSAFSWTVTRGIVSGQNRMVEVAVNGNSADYVMSVIQTDTAINNGNSGGPLCNSNGEVIGITTLKLSSDGVEGMGFAIPIEHAISTAEEIIKGEESIPYVGIAMLDISSILNVKEYSNIINEADVEEGVIITSIEADSPAADSDLKVDDIIVAVSGTDITSVSTFRFELYKHNIGDTITMTVIRNGELQSVDIKLSSKPTS